VLADGKSRAEGHALLTRGWRARITGATFDLRRWKGSLHGLQTDFYVDLYQLIGRTGAVSSSASIGPSILGARDQRRRLCAPRN